MLRSVQVDGAGAGYLFLKRNNNNNNNNNHNNNNNNTSAENSLRGKTQRGHLELNRGADRAHEPVELVDALLGGGAGQVLQAPYRLLL